MQHEPIVVVCGTFDLLHQGHRDFFEQAAQHGDLHVIVARDANVVNIKKRAPTQCERSRLARVAREPTVARAHLGDRVDFLRKITAIRPDVIALGYDQHTFFVQDLKEKLAVRGLTPRIIRLRAHHPHIFKSSKLRRA